MSMHIFVIISVTLAIADAATKVKAPVCLTGIFHKPKPGPESADYKACHLFKNSTCCTAEFTQQLAVPAVKKIGNFSWVQCSQEKLSPKCEEFMKEVECFYQCSPNVGYWKGQYQGSFKHVPVCASFCDQWFSACKSDMTCAKNWITDFNKTADNRNICKSPCQNFTEVYKNGKGLCEGMWGDSFKYKDTECMQLNFTGKSMNPNTKLVEKIFGQPSSAILMSQTVGFVFALLLISVLLV